MSIPLFWTYPLLHTDSNIQLYVYHFIYYNHSILSDDNYNQPLHTVRLYNQPIHTVRLYNQPLHTVRLYNQPLHTVRLYNQPLHTVRLYNQPILTVRLYNQPLHTVVTMPGGCTVAISSNTSLVTSPSDKDIHTTLAAHLMRFIASFKGCC